MPSFCLNFQQSVHERRWPGYVLFSLGLLALAGWYVSYTATAKEIAELALQQEQRAQKKEIQPVAFDPRQQELARQKSDLLQKISKQQALPWPSLFNALEVSKPEQIMLFEIQPDTTTASILITGQAGDLNEVLSYTAALKKQSVFSNVNLLDHQFTKVEGKATVNFEIEMLWH